MKIQDSPRKSNIPQRLVMAFEMARAVETPFPDPDMSSPSKSLPNLSFIMSISVQTSRIKVKSQIRLLLKKKLVNFEIQKGTRQFLLSLTTITFHHLSSEQRNNISLLKFRISSILQSPFQIRRWKELTATASIVLLFSFKILNFVFANFRFSWTIGGTEQTINHSCFSRKLTWKLGTQFLQFRIIEMGFVLILVISWNGASVSIIFPDGPTQRRVHRPTLGLGSFLRGRSLGAAAEAALHHRLGTRLGKQLGSRLVPTADSPPLHRAPHLQLSTARENVKPREQNQKMSQNELEDGSSRGEKNVANLEEWASGKDWNWISGGLRTLGWISRGDWIDIQRDSLSRRCPTSDVYGGLSPLKIWFLKREGG